jgi:sorbitol-6-phosphate 2-dehydrogenase
MSTNNHRISRDIAPILRGAAFDGKHGPFVRTFDLPEGRSTSGLTLDVPKAASLKEEPVDTAAILSQIGEFVSQEGTFPPRIRFGNNIFAVGETPEDVASIDATPSPDSMADLRRRGAHFRGIERDTPTVADFGAGIMRGRVAVVTGGAQGFGLEIASALTDVGAIVFLADVNVEGARQQAQQLNAEKGRTVAYSVAANVSDEASVASMIDYVVSLCGGLDLFISNAGVLRAGSVKEISAEDFRFVTEVNYVGMFLCAKHVSPVLALQHSAAAQRPGSASYFSDLIQINSKSGLEGSNKNGAYAGSKFGGIGLVQSFAKELIEDGVKVNAVCPGNFFDGPLWSDPDRGLFVQYLRAGKVPAATSVEDVKRSYEEKVPMKRGCTGLDVVRAIVYLVNQLYETGQALPVTGGQVMLS